MIPASQLDPFTTAQTLLDLVVEGFATEEVDLPPVQYVAPGISTPWDGPQLTVNFQGVTYGQPGAGNDTIIVAQPQTYTLGYQVTLLRETPVLQDGVDGFALPMVADMQNSAQSNMKDVMTLRQVLYTIIRNYQLVDRGSRATLSPVLPVGPTGGLVGAASTITILGF